MELPTTTVTILEANETRAELYNLWLEECDVRIALTPREARDTLDANVGVVVLNEDFGSADTADLVDAARNRAPACRVVGILGRAAVFPDVSFEGHLGKPIFEDDLVPLVKRLLHRVNYHVAITRYYELNAAMAALERADSETYEQAEYDELDRESAFLRRLLAAVRSELSDSDVAAVLEAATVSPTLPEKEGDTEGGSKYRPSECPHCDVPWTGQPGPSTSVVRLGAFVWRCTACGEVVMISDPSHQRLGSYRI